MDRRINYRLVIDTETCPLDKDFEGVSPYNMFVYDIGWAIVDRMGNVYRTRSFMVKEIFMDESALMQSAYYADKIPMYLKQMAEGSRVLAKWFTIRQILLRDLAEFEITEIYAHNMRFDYGALANTHRWLTKSKYRYYFPKECEICDTLKMARQVIAPMKKYKKFCKENDFMTKNNQVKLTAEVIYRFITNDLEFVESHTGLEDVLIEKEIFAYCYKHRKEKLNRKLWE